MELGNPRTGHGTLLEAWWIWVGAKLGAILAGRPRAAMADRRKGDNAEDKVQEKNSHSEYSIASTSRAGWSSRGGRGCRKKKEKERAKRKGAEGIGYVFGTRRLLGIRVKGAGTGGYRR